MLINESLEKYGLSPKESAVYLATLELGKAPVQAIAKKAELPRSTVYSVLEYLIRKNLIFPISEGKIQQYSPEDPQKLINVSEESTRALKNALPELKNLFRLAKSRPKIKYYEGLSALKEMYNDILRQKGLKEYLIIAAENNWMDLDPVWFEDFKKRRASAKIKTRLILEDSPAAKERQKSGMKYLSEVKILPTDLPYKWGAGVYIFRDKVIFVEYIKNVIGVEIQSQGIADLQRLEFETLWKNLN